MNNKYEEIFEMAINGEKYFNNEDLRMNRKLGFLLSNKELNEYLEYKEKSDRIIKFPLKSVKQSTVNSFPGRYSQITEDGYSAR